MNRQELLTVEHAFHIERQNISMLVLSPHFPMPKTWKENGALVGGGVGFLLGIGIGSLVGGLCRLARESWPEPDRRAP